jgi:ABC-type Mn2+/Zn2+ transport system ATPase subunit
VTIPAGPAAPLFELTSVGCRLGQVDALTDVTLAVGAGDFIGVVGPSGSGKTTFLKVLLEAVRPTAGRFARRPGLHVGYVPQVETINWSFPVTVAEVVLMARKQSSWRPWATAAERRDVGASLDRLGLAGLAGRHIRDLSGGQQQRVFIARALLGRPDVLLMDEPTSGVDVRTRHEVLHLLSDLNAGGLAIVLTTHDLNGVAAHLPRIVCLNRTVIGQGTPAEVLTPDILERTYGAPLDVLQHAGMPLVVERALSAHRPVPVVGP